MRVSIIDTSNLRKCFFLRSPSSLVDGVVGSLASLETSVIVDEGRLVERLRLVEAKTVEGANLVGVSVLLGGPCSSVPELTAAGVSGSELVGSDLLQLEVARVVKLNGGVAVAPVGAVKGSGGEVASAGGRGVVVDRLMVAGSAELSLSAVTTRVGVELGINLADFAVVESGGGEIVLGVVEGLGVEDFAGLLGDGLAEMVVVLAEAGDVALVAGEDSSFAFNGGLTEKGLMEMWELPWRTYRWWRCGRSSY
jgi:hypothetical protein